LSTRAAYWNKGSVTGQLRCTGSDQQKKRRIDMIQNKVLVTGATGDTGRATVDELLARGYQVRALAHAQDERSKRLQERGVEVIYGDLLDIGGRPPMTLEAFIERHRAAFD
jgi:nucleoside-diphosphate-sugar epimerase